MVSRRGTTASWASVLLASTLASSGVAACSVLTSFDGLVPGDGGAGTRDAPGGDRLTGDGSAADAPASDATTDGSKRDGPIGDGSVDGGGDAGDAGTDAPPPPVVGWGAITIQTTFLSAQTQTDAEFHFGQPSGCASLPAVGSCSVQQCTTADGGPGAGVITITGGTMPSMLTPGGNGNDVAYPAVASATSFEAGAPIDVSAPGDVVPPFDVMATWPQPIAVTMPPPGALSISPSQSLTFTWTGASSILVELVAYQGAAMRTAVICLFANGSGIMPASAIQSFKQMAGGGGGMDVLAAFPITLATSTPPGWLVEVHAMAAGALWLAQVH